MRISRYRGKNVPEVGKVGQEVEFGLEDHQEERLSREGL